MIRLLATGLMVAFCMLIPLAAPLPGAGVADAREPAGDFSKGITRLELAKVLAGHGMSVRDATLDEKDPWLKARTPKGVEFYVNMYQCTGTGPARRRCSNLQFLAQWERTKRTTLEAANTYNQRFVFGRAYLSQDGKTFMFDYSVNLQEGITAGNLRKHVDNWLRVLDDVRSLLKV